MLGLVGAIAGAAAGAISTGTLRGALAGALGGALFAGIGTSGLGDVGRIAAHAAAGCVSAVAGGGSCASGALSAGFGKVASLYGLEFGDSTWGKIAGGVQAAIVGGTASVLGGGNFENGAVTAAMGYVLNQLQQEATRRAAFAEARRALGAPANAKITVSYDKLYDGNTGDVILRDKYGRPVTGRVYELTWDNGTKSGKGNTD